MLDRNLLKAGDSVFPMPIGIPVTLKYDLNGKLVEVSVDNKTENSDLLFSYFIKYSYAPARILTNNGYATVKGVLYSGDSYYEELGIIPECQIDSMIEDIKLGQEFVFCAGYADVTSINMNTLAQVRTWLQSNKFQILPNFIIPLGDLDDACKRALKATDINYQNLMGFYIYRGTEFVQYFLHYEWDKITYLDAFLDTSGNIRCNVSTALGKNEVLSFYEVATLNLYSEDIILVDKEGHFTFNMSSYLRSDKPDYSYTCPMCGKQYVVGDEYTKCPNVHCYSRLYDDLCHFVSKLNLPDLDYAEYVQSIEEGKLTKFSDILLLPQYRDFEIKVSLPDLLEAIIPYGPVRNRTTIWDLYNKCNGSLNSIQHYIENPEDIYGDLQIDDSDLSVWLMDTYNANTILEIIQYTNVVLTQEVKKFEGSPIFRETPIAITGTFKHGSYAEISSILLSYNAKVSNGRDAEICIVGDIPENVDGRIIQDVKSRGGYVYSESEFFYKYGIDEDLEQCIR